jgi:preprotein translocase subunit YajC
MHYALILAEDPPKDTPKQGQGQPPSLLETMGPILLIFAALYFLLLRPQARRREMERQALLNSLEKDDEVLTLAGIYGNVARSPEANEDTVILKVDDKVRIKVAKASISRNFTAEERAKSPAAKDSGPTDNSASSDSTGIRKA